MNKREFEKIVEENVEEIKRIGGEITNIEKKVDCVKIHFKDHNCDCYGGFLKVRTVKFQKEERKYKKTPKPQRGEYCPHCGNRIEKKYKFCPHCGQKITNGDE